MRGFVEIVKQPDPVDHRNSWTIVARAQDVPHDRGVAALVNDVPVAVFRLAPMGSVDEWYAVSHLDPIGGAPVMARGLVGSQGAESEVPTIASPLDKRRYDLRTGACLDDESPPLLTFDIQVIDGRVLVRELRPPETQ